MTERRFGKGSKVRRIRLLEFWMWRTFRGFKGLGVFGGLQGFGGFRCFEGSETSIFGVLDGAAFRGFRTLLTLWTIWISRSLQSRRIFERITCLFTHIWRVSLFLTVVIKQHGQVIQEIKLVVFSVQGVFSKNVTLQGCLCNSCRCVPLSSCPKPGWVKVTRLLFLNSAASTMWTFFSQWGTAILCLLDVQRLCRC